MEACRAQLSKHGLAIIQSTQFDGENKWIETVLAHSSGEWVSSRYPVKPAKDDLQGLGSATTYARRYALMALVGIVAEDEDDDAEAAVGRANGNGKHTPAPEPAKRPQGEKPEETARKWAKEAETALRGCKTLDALRTFEAKHDATIQRLGKIDRDAFDGLMAVLSDMYEKLAPAQFTA